MIINRDTMINKFDDTTRETMLELEKTQREFWNISRVTAEFLYLLIIEHGAKNVLEVGTSNGYSGLWLSKALKVTGGHLTTIEYYPKRQNIAIENFTKCGTMDVVTPIIGSACDVLRDLPREAMFDFVFVDANKRESIEYFKLIHPHLVKGGIYTCDNVLSHQEKVQPFIDAINAHPDYENVVLPLPAGLSLARKLR